MVLPQGKSQLGRLRPIPHEAVSLRFASRGPLGVSPVSTAEVKPRYFILSFTYVPQLLVLALSKSQQLGRLVSLVSQPADHFFSRHVFTCLLLCS